MQVVGHDGGPAGDDALALARALAPHAPGLRRLVVHVVREATAPPPMAQRVREAERRLAAVADRLREGEALRVVTAGSVARGLQEVAEAEDAGLVVVGPTHRHAVGQVLLGTTAERLLHGSPAPVAAATPGFVDREAVERVLVAYDGSAEARAALALAAAVPGATCDVVTARRPVAAYAGHPGTTGMVAHVVAEADAQARGLAEEALAGLPAAARGDVHVSGIDPGRAIVQEAADADLVVVGSRAYGPVRRVLLGSTGSHVLHHAPCSVLVVPRAAEDAASAAA